MRIGMLTQWFDPEPGPARLPGALARSLVERGHDVQVVTGFPNYPSGEIHDGFRQAWRHDEVWHGVKVRRVPLYPNHGESVLGRLANYGSFGASALVRGVPAWRDIDVLWVSNSPVTVALPMWRAIRRYRVPTLLHVLDLWPDNVISSEMVPSRGAVRAIVGGVHRWNARMYASADHVAAISPGIAKTIVERGVPANKVSYLPMWADESNFHLADGAAVRRKHGAPTDRVVVLYAGTLGRTQAIDSLIEGAHRYDPSAPPIDIWIAGGGIEEDRIRQMLGKVEHPRVRTRFLGRVPASRMAEVMAAADIHYVGLRGDANSRITMPSKVQATMACGRAMLIAVSGDAETVVMSVGSGIRADARDPETIADGLASASLLGRAGLSAMGSRARVAYDRDFSLSAGTDRVEATFRSITKGRKQ